MPSNTWNGLGKTIKARRKALRLSRSKLSKITGLAPWTIQQCEYGRNVRLDTFVIIAKTLGFTIKLECAPQRELVNDRQEIRKLPTVVTKKKLSTIESLTTISYYT